MKRFGNIILMFLVTACSSDLPMEGKYPSVNKDEGTTQQPGADEGETPSDGTDGSMCKILFIGNSLTLDATHFLPGMLNAAGVRNVEMTRVFRGACTIPLYNENYMTDDFCSVCTWKAGQPRWSGDEVRDSSPQDAVKAGEYDIICVQEYGGKSCAWSWSAEEKSAVTGLLGKIKADQGGNQPRLVFLFSHVYAGFYDTVVNNFNGDDSQMFNTCAQTFKQMMQESDFEDVISTAAVIQNLRTTGLNKVNTFDMTRGDGIHLDYGMGRYAAACVIFKKLITPLTGKHVEDNPLRLSEYYPHSSFFTTPVTSENLPVIYAAVDAAIERPFEITDMSSYSSVPVYENRPGSTMFEEYEDVPDACSFPVIFPVGNSANDSYSQPYWSGYGLWICRNQPQAFAKWAFASHDVIPGKIPTRTWANDSSISSIAIRGIWTGDYFEFVIPVEEFSAGTAVNFEAPFYTRQGPVFWIFEWLDGDEWKCEMKDVTSWDGSFTRRASFALKLGTTIVTQQAVFENAVSKGKLRFRIRCADGSIQADTATSKAVQRNLPNHTSTDYSSVFYFHGGQYVRFTIGNK